MGIENWALHLVGTIVGFYDGNDTIDERLDGVVVLFLMITMALRPFCQAGKPRGCQPEFCTAWSPEDN